MIARKNQLFDDILDVDQKLKDAAVAGTPAGSRGFFFANPLDARRALPNTDIVKIDPYVQEYFKDGVLINRLQGQYTSREIAEAFGNSAKVSQWMRGETGGKFSKTASFAYRNLFLTPKRTFNFFIVNTVLKRKQNVLNLDQKIVPRLR